MYRESIEKEKPSEASRALAQEGMFLEYVPEDVFEVPGELANAD